MNFKDFTRKRYDLERACEDIGGMIERAESGHSTPDIFSQIQAKRDRIEKLSYKITQYVLDLERQLSRID